MSDIHPANPEEKLITYSSSQPYETLNARTGKTKQVWVVFHGIGFLSRYFLRYFSHLDPNANYIIAPQAPSLYYLDPEYRNVGASWLTREQTSRNMENLLNYLDALYLAESLEDAPGLVFMGYSQGVSVVTRWIAKRNLSCTRMLLYAGRVPTELTPSDFEHLPLSTSVKVFAGEQDPFLRESDRPQLKAHLKELFGPRLEWIDYPGGHELNKAYIR